MFYFLGEGGQEEEQLDKIQLCEKWRVRQNETQEMQMRQALSY